MITLHPNLQKTILASIGATGFLVFTFFLSLTFHTPAWVEQFAASFIEKEIAKRVDATIDAIQPPEGDSALSRAAAALHANHEEQIEQYREALRQRVHERMADAIAEMRDLDCECREKWAQWLKDDTSRKIRLLEQTNRQITDFVQSNYVRVVTDFKREIRIFTSANAIVFLLILSIAILKPAATLQLFVPGILATAAIIICSTFYIFAQNWLLTIILGNYIGFAYLAWLAIIFLLLCDIVLNRARITTEIINTILNAIGSTLSAVPC